MTNIRYGHAARSYPSHHMLGQWSGPIKVVRDIDICIVYSKEYAEAAAAAKIRRLQASLQPVSFAVPPF